MLTNLSLTSLRIFFDMFRSAYRSAGVLAPTLDTMIGSFWSIPPLTLNPNLPCSSGVMLIRTRSPLAASFNDVTPPSMSSCLHRRANGLPLRVFFSGVNWSFGGVAGFKKIVCCEHFLAPLSERSTGGGGGGAGGWVPTVSGDTPMTLEEERTVPELLPPSVLLPRSDKDDSSVLGRKIR